jgi:polyvinyl alcohol dehydrogenase (cytochrome)
MKRFAVVVCALAVIATGAPRSTALVHTKVGSADWPTYGRSERHTFKGSTTLTADSVKTLMPNWFFATGDIVTANPIEVGGTVFVGSWDGYFYAIDAKSGALRWKYRVKDQAAITPQPGNRQPTDLTSDGGIITSSAFFQPGTGTMPDLVIFGGGYTLYALRASDGHVFWMHDYTGRPDKPADAPHDPTRIFSSPVVVNGKVLFGVTPDSVSGYRGYAAAADLRTGDLLWRFETNVDKAGRLLNNGCGGVWSSPTIVRAANLAVYDVADCKFSNPNPYDEKVFALRIDTGKLAWVMDPQRKDDGCDFDFGATANLGLGLDGKPAFLGVGGKDGTYYSMDPYTGKLRWKRKAIGDFGRFEGFGDLGCDLGNPADLPAQEPTLHALDGKTGAKLWSARSTLSFAPTSVAGGMTFVCADLGPQNVFQRIDIRDAATGIPDALIPLPVACQSGIVPVGNTIFFGTGTSEEPQPAGVWAYTPLGEPVTIPR